MREYLFRGKRVDNGEWVEGFYHYTNWLNPTTREIVETRHYIRPAGCQDAFCVIAETVGQYAGVCDKNGRKIFEGDIISIMFETDGVDGFSGYSWYESAEVVYSEEKCAWIVVFDDGGEEMYLSEYDDVDDICVIANVFENANLLESDGN